MRDDTALAGRRLIAALTVFVVAGCGAEQNLGPEQTARLVEEELRKPRSVTCRRGVNGIDYACTIDGESRGATALVEVDEGGITSLRWFP